MKTKILLVKNLRHAIRHGLSYETAAEHALGRIRLGGRDEDGSFRKWVTASSSSSLKARVKKIRTEIAEKQKEIKSLQAELKKFV